VYRSSGGKKGDSVSVGDHTFFYGKGKEILQFRTEFFYTTEYQQLRE